jgi:UDP-N-acetylglucosamine 4,6-dehydratase
MNYFRSLRRWQKKIVLASNDIFFILLSLWLAFALRLGVFFPIEIMLENYLQFVILPVLGVLLLNQFGLYRSVLKYFNPEVFKYIIITVTIMMLATALILIVRSNQSCPRSVLPIFWSLSLLMLISSRYIARIVLYPHIGMSSSLKAVAIYGAGEAGTQLLDNLINSEKYRPAIFFDDKKELHDTIIRGIDVVSPQKIEQILENKKIDLIVLAIPSLTNKRRREILQYLTQYNLEVRIAPGLDNLLNGHLSIEDIRKVDVKDILGRDKIVPDSNLLTSNIKDKIVLITGAGGSIGSELCRQILRLNPKEILLLDQSEFALYKIHMELKQICRDCIVIPVLASITNKPRLKRLFEDHQVDTIYHAAAYKHVPMVEMNPLDGVYNNVIGTYRLATAAVVGNVTTFVLISTDKAVRPTNIMGATKRFAELILQGMELNGNKTQFTMVRFGNVLDSAGSVIPLFRDQLKNGGPLTVTHKDVTRYFMLIPEAVELVIQAGAMAEGGDVFVLDMGISVNIYDLAKRVIALSGNDLRDIDNPNGNIEIEIIGLRPGEKLYEELLIGNDTSGTEHPRIMRANEAYFPWDQIESTVNKLHNCCRDQNFTGVNKIFNQYVEGYK